MNLGSVTCKVHYNKVKKWLTVEQIKYTDWQKKRYIQNLSWFTLADISDKYVKKYH